MHFSAHSGFPSKLRAVCFCLNQVTSTRFHKDSHVVLGSMLFHRFYIPFLGDDDDDCRGDDDDDDENANDIISKLFILIRF